MMPELRMAAKAVVWQKSTQPELETSIIDAVLRNKGNTCLYCGFTSEENGIHHKNNNPCDTAPENLAVICSICKTVAELESCEPGSKIAYLPGLPTAAGSHLLRAIVIAQKIPDLAEEANELLNWLQTHSQYTAVSFTSDAPKDFVDALRKLPETASATADILDGLFPIPATGNQPLGTEDTKKIPAQDWNALYHDAIKALA